MDQRIGDLFAIAVLGGGLSGAILASKLLRGRTPAVTVVLIEREQCLGRGVLTARNWPGTCSTT